MPTIDDVKSCLSRRGIVVLQFSEPTPTVEAAARAVGCSEAEIAKTILLIVGAQPVVVVAAGDVRVNSSLLKKSVGVSGKVRLPDADEVLHHTGYRPGGVCPFLLPDGLPVLIDSSLRRFQAVYPAAGDDYSAVPITYADLLEVSGGREACVCI